MQRQIVRFVSESAEVRTTMDEEQVPENAEWLVRRDEVDYGPYATEEVLTAISSKEVHMGTWIAELSHAEFEPLGSWAIFRDHYAECQARWDQEIAEAEARRVERRMRAVRMVRMVTFVVVLVIALQAIGGLVVAAALRYAGNVLKCFAVSISICNCAVATTFLSTNGGHGLSASATLGVALVIGSTFLYSNVF